MLFICCLREVACLHEPRAEWNENKACGTKKKVRKHYWSLTMRRRMYENETGPYDWLKKGSFFFLTPTVSNLSVHSLLQFNYSSHCQESLQHPPSSCSIRTPLHSIPTFPTYPLLQTTLVTYCDHIGYCFFMVRVFFFMNETPRHMEHIWNSLMRGSVSLFLPLHFWVVGRFQPSLLSLAKAKKCWYIEW